MICVFFHKSKLHRTTKLNIQVPWIICEAYNDCVTHAVKIHAHKFYVEKVNTTKRKEGVWAFTLKYLKADKCGRTIEF